MRTLRRTVQLLAADHFKPIFEPLVGRRVGYVPTAGGIGDRLVEMAAFQLFARFGVDYLIESLGGGGEATQLVLPGGGPGPLVPEGFLERFRERAATTPVTILPRSLGRPLMMPLRRCHLRDRASLKHEPDGILGPDLILGLDVTAPGEAEEDEGLWLRRDSVGLFAGQGSGDPELACVDAAAYLALAARYRSVVTDRPEFAMAALIQGRQATLVASASPIGRSLFDTWLADLGCRWRDAEEQADRAVASVARGVQVPQGVPAADGTEPVFIIGAPRSGTTALARALGRHSRFYAGDETLFLLELFGDERAEKVHERWAGRPSSSWLRRENVSRERFLAALGQGLDSLFSSSTRGRRWVDHVPSHAMMADTIAGLFPAARFLHILRDGREVVNSMLNVPKTLGGDLGERMRQAEFLPGWTRDFRVACETWLGHVRAATDFERRNPGRCLTVRHRDLEADPAAAMAAVFRFLGAPDERRPAHFLRKGWRINSSFAPPGGCPSVEYRRPPADAAWTDEQKAIFDELCGAEMAAHGLA